MNSALTLKHIAEYMSSQEVAEKLLRFASKNYLLNEKDFRSVCPSLILQLITIQSPQHSSPSSQTEVTSQTKSINNNLTFWHPNQFKIFAWISVCYAFITNRDIQEFNEEDLDILRIAFPSKDSLFLEYNLRCLLKQDRSTKQGWQEEEVALLQSIIMKDTLRGKWSDISFSLFAQSNRRFFRSSHKCREKWYNHLDPAVRHKKWAVEEDMRLFELVSHLGQRWAAISKAMSGARTEHMVKNRFKSIYKRYEARYQRSSFKKIIEIILKDLLKKVNAESSETNDHKALTVKTEEPQLKARKAFNTELLEPEGIEDKQKSSTALDLLPQWQDYEYEEAGYFLQQQECFRLIYMKEKIELIDYCLLELDQHPTLLQ